MRSVKVLPSLRCRHRGATASLAAALLVSGLLVFATAGALAGLAPAARSSAPPRGHALVVSFASGPGGPVVPSRFLGLSFEAESIPQLARYASEGDLPLLLRSLGPGVLRLGGVTADSRVAFVQPPATPPSWADVVISPADLTALAALTRSANDQALLTVGLLHDDPAAAAQEAAAAAGAFGDSLLGLEIGNEPDAYGTHGVRPAPWTFAQYAPEVDAYRAAISAAAPGVAIAGPDTTGAAFATWGRAEASVEHPALLTAHRYPLVCSARPAPSIGGLLSATTRARDITQLSSDAAIAAAAGIPLRIDETNSVSCGGRAGVSNTFAAALWAVQFMTEAMRLGISGVNFHDLPASCAGYSPLCAQRPQDLADGHLTAAPEWYALLFVRSLIGDRPLTTTATGSSPSVVASAFRDGGRIRILLTDTDPSGPARTVRIAVGPAPTTATVLALTAPSLAASTGVRIGGRGVNARGELLGPLQRTRLRSAHGAITVALPPASAALVTVGGA